jgi:two-component system, LytTR family, sensor kinase
VRRLAFALAGFSLLGILQSAHLAFYWHSLGRRFTLAEVLLREGLPMLVFALCVPAVARWGERFPLEWPPRARSVLAHLSGIAATIAFLAAMRTIVERALHVTAPSMPLLHLRDNLVYLSPDGLIVYGATVGLAYAASYAARTRQLLELQAELSNAQLRALRMQLNPHFFFNALHTIGALVRDGNQRGAVELIEKLGDVLRHVLRPDAQPDAPLRTEIEFLRKYLEIEQVRFGDRLRVSWEVDARSESVPVPQLILQPLVENALRHGLSRRVRAGSLTIRSSLENGHLEMLVVDDGVGLPPDFESGIGIANVRARLQHRYGDTAQLSLATRAEGGVSARIVLPVGTRP